MKFHHKKLLLSFLSIIVIFSAFFYIFITRIDKYIFMSLAWNCYVKERIFKLNKNLKEKNILPVYSKDERATALFINDSKIIDISPCRMLPIDGISIQNSFIDNLNALKYKHVTHLFIRDSVINDASFLSFIPLEELSLARTNIRDLSPLNSLPIYSFTCVGNKQITDFSSLEGKKLSFLSIRDMDITDLKPLKKYKNLKCLILENTKVSDLGPLTGLKLNQLDIENTLVKDLTPLSGMKLRFLNITGTPASHFPLPTGLKCDSIAGHLWRKGEPLKPLGANLHNQPHLEHLGSDHRNQAHPAK